jgi:hypothetical protein
MTMRSSLAFLLVASACAPAAVTPPSRTLAMESPLAGPPGHSDLQLAVGHAGTGVFGPSLSTGAGSLRTTVEPGVVVEAEGSVLKVDNQGDTSAPSRTGYTGRLGVLLQSDDQRSALVLGAGAGTSPATGAWAAADVGGVLTGKNHWVRPVLGSAVGYSAPLDNHTFVVYDDHDPITLQLPRNIYARLDLGLEIGPPGRALLLGVSIAQFWLMTPDIVDGDKPHTEETYGMIGIGTRISLD